MFVSLLTKCLPVLEFSLVTSQFWNCQFRIDTEKLLTIKEAHICDVSGKCFYILLNAFIRYYMLSYTCIHLHTLSFAFICFYMLLFAFKCLSKLKCHPNKPADHVFTGFHLRKPVKKSLGTIIAAQ